MFKQFYRHFHKTHTFFATTDKKSLAALRKKTGYAFSNCKKALEINNNDLAKAEKWLAEQAQTMGWSKVTKLEGRDASQGLIGVLVRGNIGAMVEVNCETDFVARNEVFRKFVDNASKICAKYTEMTEFDGHLWKLGFESDALKNLKLDDGKTLGDHLALMVGTVGENAILRRAICFKTNNELKLSAYAHPSLGVAPENITQFGRYGAIVAFRSKDLGNDEELRKNLCQHIVGMNPIKVGEKNQDKPVENKDDEQCLIHQEYLLDPEKSVGDILEEHKIEIIDFQRYECGEELKGDSLNLAQLKN